MTQEVNYSGHWGASSAVAPRELQTTLAQTLGNRALQVKLYRGEITVDVSADEYYGVMQTLRDAPGCRFEQMLDLCGMDYLDYRDGAHDGARFAVVVHLLSVSLNQRVRVRAFCPDDGCPMMESVTSIWTSANWYEREAFDMYGIVFNGHGDLRRILTDYGFIGHPLRKDFPLSGHVEMRYDPERRRVVYEPVTIEPRDITPRIIREDNYGGLH